MASLPWSLLTASVLAAVLGACAAAAPELPHPQAWAGVRQTHAARPGAHAAWQGAYGGGAIPIEAERAFDEESQRDEWAWQNARRRDEAEGGIHHCIRRNPVARANGGTRRAGNDLGILDAHPDHSDRRVGIFRPELTGEPRIVNRDGPRGSDGRPQHGPEIVRGPLVAGDRKGGNFGADLRMVVRELRLIVVHASVVQQTPRPCVPAVRSLSRGWINRSSTRTAGSPVMNFFHSAPPLSETNTPNSVPTKSRLLFFASSRMTFTLPVGRLFMIEVQVAP